MEQKLKGEEEILKLEIEELKTKLEKEKEEKVVEGGSRKNQKNLYIHYSQI